MFASHTSPGSVVHFKAGNGRLSAPRRVIHRALYSDGQGGYIEVVSLVCKRTRRYLGLYFPGCLVSA